MRPTGLVSVIIAVADGEATIGAAIASLKAQSHADWEAIIVSDDGRDYLAHLGSIGLTDDRLRQVSSGGRFTGCAAARNVGLAIAKGDYITRLDADDVFHPERLARLIPFAARFGAVADNLDQVDLDGGAQLARPFPMTPCTFRANFNTIGLLDCPIVPLVRRDHAFPWYDGVDIAEDVIHALRLVAEVGELAVVTAPLYEYRIRLGSMCHGEDGAERADRSYGEIIARLRAGTMPGIDRALGVRMSEVFERKRALNLVFGDALAAGHVRTFPEFIALQKQAAAA